MNASRCVTLLLVFCLTLTAAAVFAAEAPSDLPQGRLTLGAQFGEDQAEGFGDVFVPFYLTKSGIWYLNPRGSMNDDDEEEANLGLGYRHLFAEKNIIVGGNIYYDSRWTQHDNQFNQLGLGVEVLTEWVDARANYYLPEDKEELVDRFTEQTVDSSTSVYWDDPYATGNSIRQRGLKVTTVTTTTFLFERFEQAREGWDAEVGVKLPGLEQWVDLRVFGGYYSWEAQYTGQEDIEGFKGRLEARVAPALYLDAGVYEDKELNGSEWYVGGRVNLPFDLVNASKGKNPFAGAAEDIKRGEQRFSDRLFEMVIRDLQIRTEISEYSEKTEARQVDVQTSKETLRETLLDDITFVDGDNNGFEDGTYENPFNLVQEGVDNAFGDLIVYVFQANDDYQENVVIADSTRLYGEGQPIDGRGGKSFGGDKYPLVDGMSLGPTFTMGNDALLAGFKVSNTDDGGPAQNVLINGQNYDISRVGIYALDVNDFNIRDNIFEGNTFGGLIGVTPGLAAPEFEMLLVDNTFRDNVNDGLRIEAQGASGIFTMNSIGNGFHNNGGEGVDVNANTFDLVNVMFEGGAANGNANDGYDLQGIDSNTAVFVSMRNIRANDNGNDGIDAETMANNDEFFGIFDGISVDNNNRNGIIVDAGSTNMALGIFADIQATRNGKAGIDIGMTASQGGAIAIVGPDGAIVDAITGFGLPIVLPPEILGINGSGLVAAEGNATNGLQIAVHGDELALAALFDIAARNNGGNGLDLDVVSTDGVAVAVGMPSHDLLGVAEFGVNLIGGLFGFPPIELPEASYQQRMQFVGNAENGVRAEIVGDDAAIGALLGMNARMNGWSGFDIDITSSNNIAVGVLAGVNANNNATNGLDVTVAATGVSVGVFADIIANDNRDGKGMLANVVSADSVAIGALVSSGSLNDLLDLIGIGGIGFPYNNGPNQFNNNGSDGLDFNVISAEDTAIALVVDAEAENNGDDGIDIDMFTPDGSSIAALLMAEANDNADDGFDVSIMATGTAVLAAMDVSASGNVQHGFESQVTSMDSTAAAVFLSSRTIFDLLDIIGLNVASAGSGPNRFNNNGADGINLELVADDMAVAVLSDIQANGNINDGVFLNSIANDMGITALLLAEANNNLGDGFEVRINATNEAILAAMDVEASDNIEAGFESQIMSMDSTAAAVFLSSRTVFGLVDALGLGLPFALPEGNGPNRFNDNGENGIELNIIADDMAIAGILDTVARRNGGNGIEVFTLGYDDAINLFGAVHADMNGDSGIFLASFASNDVFTILGDFTANDNATNGVAIRQVAEQDSNVILGTTGIGYQLIDDLITALGGPGIGPSPIPLFGPNEINRNGETGMELLSVAGQDQNTVILDTEFRYNGGSGLEGIAVAGDSALTLIGYSEFDRNADNGLDLTVLASNTAITAIMESQANNNEAGDGFLLNTQSSHSNVVNVFAAVLARQNDGNGINLTSAASNSVMTILTDVEARENGGRGFLMDATSLDPDTGVALFAMNDITFVLSNALNAAGVDIPEPLFAIIPQGTVRTMANGSGGFRVNVNSAGDFVAVLDGVRSSQNINRGVALNANAGDDINVELLNSTIDGNGTAGFRTDFTAANNIMVIGENNNIRNSGNRGVNIIANAGGLLTVDFGGGGASAGNNNIFGSGGQDFRVNGGQPADAEFNWWGQDPPVAGQFSGGVNFNNWLNAPAP